MGVLKPIHPIHYEVGMHCSNKHQTHKIRGQAARVGRFRDEWGNKQPTHVWTHKFCNRWTRRQHRKEAREMRDTLEYEYWLDYLYTMYDE